MIVSNTAFSEAAQAKLCRNLLNIDCSDILIFRCSEGIPSGLIGNSFTYASHCERRILATELPHAPISQHTQIEKQDVHCCIPAFSPWTTPNGSDYRNVETASFAITPLSTPCKPVQLCADDRCSRLLGFALEGTPLGGKVSRQSLEDVTCM